MKVTHLTTVHPPDDNRIFKICKSIARMGQEVSFVVPADHDRVVEDRETKPSILDPRDNERSSPNCIEETIIRG